MDTPVNLLWRTVSLSPEASSVFFNIFALYLRIRKKQDFIGPNLGTVNEGDNSKRQLSGEEKKKT